MTTVSDDLHTPKNGPDAHFEYFKQWYDYVNDYSIVKKARAGYDVAKHSCTLAETGCGLMESGIQTGLNGVAAPVYANYCYPATDKLVEYYARGLDTTKSAVDKTVAVAAHTGALSVGLAIVTAQMGLIATTSATNAFLSSLIYTKHAGYSALQGVQNMEKAVEQRIHETIDVTLQAAKVPADKMTEQTNTFLDIANTVFDRLLGLAPIQEPVNASISDRVKFLSRRVSGGLVNQANDNVIHPVRAAVYEFAQQMNRNLILADYVKQRREWASEKVETLSANVLELRNKIEKEAQQYAIAPEEMLIRSIRKTSALLNENFQTLKKQGVELVGEATTHHIDAATHFIEQLDDNFAKAENIYQIRDEVMIEAKQKVSEMAQWTAGFLVGEHQQQPADNGDS